MLSFFSGFYFLSLLLNLVYSSSVIGAVSSAAAPYIKYQAPEFLTFEELVFLSKNPRPSGALKNKLETFWRTPIISNEAWYQGRRPHKLQHPVLGPVMTAASWNIEKSLNLSQALQLFVSPEVFPNLLNEKIDPGSKKYAHLLRQRQRLALADILILQEMDIGHKRSGYLNAAEEMAKALGMNYAYGAQQLEVDPAYLGTERVHFEDGSDDPEMTAYFKTDPARYKGVFGSAVLSRYPIKAVQVFQLKNQPYNWYDEELKKISFVEKTRRLGAKLVFKNELSREIKVGGRIFMRVDLEVPELPERTLTVINVHLEIKCQPEGREKQMREILSYIRNIRHPVILMGDFNAAPNDISPTSAVRIVKRVTKNPNTWVNAAVTVLTPYGPVNTARNISNATKNVQNPFAAHVPVVAPNPLKPLFDMIEEFQFADGGVFDFRGDRERSVNGKHKKLANSNHRDLKGFKTTFQVRRPLGPIIGKLRLDWAFVKAYLKISDDPERNYLFAPHYGETLEDLNTSLRNPISDHHPNVIDLPFQEPRISG